MCICVCVCVCMHVCICDVSLWVCGGQKRTLYSLFFLSPLCGSQDYTQIFWLYGQCLDPQSHRCNLSLLSLHHVSTWTIIITL